MPRIAILTDSNSGISQDEAKELKISIVPMPFIVNGKEYFEDVNLTQEKFYELLTDDNTTISTSQPSTGSLISTWEILLQEYDQIIYIPMSSGLSGSCQTATMLALDFEDKVFVVNNQRISATQRQSVLDAIKLKKRGYRAQQIKEKLEEVKFDSSIYITVDTLKYLKKGGRLTPAVAAIGTFLKIKPVLQIQGEKLDTFSIARTTSRAKVIMKEALDKDINERFGGIEKVHLLVAHTQNMELAMQVKKELEEMYPGKSVYVGHLSLSIACHIGPGAIGIGVSKKI